MREGTFEAPLPIPVLGEGVAHRRLAKRVKLQ